MQRCTEPFIREEALDAQISALLNPYELRADWADEMLTLVKEEQKQAAQSATQLVAQKRARLKRSIFACKGSWIRFSMR